MSWFHRILYICLQTRFQKEAGKIYMLFGFFSGFRFKLDAIKGNSQLRVMIDSVMDWEVFLKVSLHYSKKTFI